MNPEREVDYMLQDCFLAVGQIIGTHKPVDADVLAWWRERYRSKFLEAMTERGTSWAKDRPRVLAVGRFLGTRALQHAAGQSTIDVRCAARASADVEAGCRMNAEREGAVLQTSPSVPA